MTAAQKQALRGRMLNHVADLLEDDARGRAENLKEFWEDCRDAEEIETASQMLREMVDGLRQEAGPRK